MCIFTAAHLRLRCRINPSAYLPSSPRQVPYITLCIRVPLNMVFATTIHTTLVIRHTYRLCGNLSKIAASFLNIAFSLSCVFVACRRMLFCIKNLMLSFVCYCFLLQFQHSPGGDCRTSTRSEPVCIRSVGWLGPCHRTSCIRGQVGCASTTRKWFYKQCHSHSFSRSIFLGSGSEMIDSQSP